MKVIVVRSRFPFFSVKRIIHHFKKFLRAQRKNYGVILYMTFGYKYIMAKLQFTI